MTMKESLLEFIGLDYTADNLQIFKEGFSGYMHADFTVYYEDGTQYNGDGEYSFEDLQAMRDADFADACQMVVEEPFPQDILDTILAIQLNLDNGETMWI